VRVDGPAYGGGRVLDKEQASERAKRTLDASGRWESHLASALPGKETECQLQAETMCRITLSSSFPALSVTLLNLSSLHCHFRFCDGVQSAWRRRVRQNRTEQCREKPALAPADPDTQHHLQGPSLKATDSSVWIRAILRYGHHSLTILLEQANLSCVVLFRWQQTAVFQHSKRRTA